MKINTKSPVLAGQLADADIRMLRIFKSVVECAGFTLAAVELNVTRSAVSIAMADLEHRLSLRLCERGRGGFAMTTEGREVYRQIQKLLVALDEFRGGINLIHLHLKGELNIGVTDNLVTMPQMRISNALAELSRLGPDVQINIQMIPPKEIENGVIDGHLHTGIIPVLKKMPSLKYGALYDEKSFLYCSGNHHLFSVNDNNISSMQLKELATVVPAYTQTKEVSDLHQMLHPSATSTDREGVAFLILTGRYLGFLPDHYAKRWVDEGRMRAVLPHKMTYKTHFAIITKKGITPNPVLENYLEQLNANP